MSVEISKLENVARRGDLTIARCPACAETDKDRKGNHLFINAKGQFGCVVNPGEDGKQHRKRIFELVGIKDHPGAGIKVKRPPSSLNGGNNVVQRDILGRLGHM